MPALKPKWERFALALAKGMTQTQAYEIIGHKPHDGNAFKLANRPEVRARVAELTERVADKVVEHLAMSKEDVLHELAKLAKVHIPEDQIRASDKRAACMDYSRLSGWIIDRAEVGEAGEFDKIKAMNGSELADFIARRSEARRLRGNPSANGAGEGEAGGQPAPVRAGSVATD